MNEGYVHPDKSAMSDLIARNIKGEVVMLNLLRFREIADYSHSPELEPDSPITGPEAYRLYLKHTAPVAEGGNVNIDFSGRGGSLLIGPDSERWDQILLVRYDSVADFVSFVTNPEYLKWVGHRTAALEDSRLLPMTSK